MKNYNILSLDGGGIRGLVLLKQLILLENILQKPLHVHFDLIAGTSTGGIVAIMLSLGYTTDEIFLLYTKHGDKIFKKSFLRFGLFRPKYDDTYFNTILKRYVGDKKLSDIKRDLLVVSYNATIKDKKIFKSSKAKQNPMYDFDLFDVIRSTASAPSFFKPHKIKDSSAFYIDGGLVINNPAMVSWVEALNQENKYDKINIISFSTGSVENPLTNKIAKGGILSWASPSVSILLAEQSTTTDYHMDKLYQREPGIYVRCNSTLTKSSGKMDDVSKKNMANMIIDGDISANNNIQSMIYFAQNT